MAAPRPSRHAHVPEGAFTYPIEAPGPTRWFGFLVLRDFTLLAFSSALDPLRVANQLAQKPLYGWVVISADGQPVRASSGVELGVDGGLDALADDLELLVCSGNRGTEVASDAVLAAIRKHARFGGRVGGICTGAMTLARAGLLKDKRFTLHWENQPGFIEAFPGLTPARTRFEADGNIRTCSGGSASTEMMLSIIAQDHGQDFAIAVADMCLNDPNLTPGREQRSSIARAIDSRNPKLLHVLRAMYANIEDPLSLEELASDAGVSRRQMERQFTQSLGEPPAAIYRNIRLDRAHSLLAETDLGVTEVATACGFNSVSVLTRHFKRRFGTTPFGKRGRR